MNIIGTLYKYICLLLAPLTNLAMFGGMACLALLPPFRKCLLRLFFRLIYRRQYFGLENLSGKQVFYISNHVTRIDPLLLLSVLPGRVAFFMSREDVSTSFLTWWAARFNLFEWIDSTDSNARQEVQSALKNGKSICFFPENRMTRTNQLKMFNSEYSEVLPENSELELIPLFIGGFYDSMFSMKEGKKFVPIPRRLYERPFLAVGKPLDKSTNSFKLRLAVDELGAESYEKLDRYYPIPPSMLIQTSRRWGFRVMAVDSLGTKMSGYKYLLSVLILRRLLRRNILAPHEKNVGVFVPMSVGGCIMNAALTIDHRVVVNLNHTFGPEILDYCLEHAEISHVLSSRKMVERFPGLNLPFFCMEDARQYITLWDKLICIFDTIFLPAFLLRWKLGISKMKPTDVVSIIFTSGSTGRPKGVMLSHRNILYVDHGFFDAMRMSDKDTMLQILPFFHGFGYVGNFWTPLICGARSVYHFNPLEPKKIGELARKHGCTLLVCAPTFLRNYMRRCPKEDFEKMETIFCGAEKLQPDLIEAWQSKYGPRPCEGYGATELSPCPIANVPESRIQYCCDDPDRTDPLKGGNASEWFRKDGSIGRALARTAVKIVDPDTGADLGVNEVGMLVAKGLLRMVGYYKDPEKTAQVTPNGWYQTGDIGRMDEDGFFWLTGRESRISKIGGEMVPHVLIEERIVKFMEDKIPEEVKAVQTCPICTVTSLPDEKKGERIIVLYLNLGVTPSEIRAELLRIGTPNIWIPAEGHFAEVQDIPLLGTGKLDLAAIKKRAQELFPDSKS